jgi:predicted GH43/DUF377 family glycosyl hydrolase
MIAVQKEGIVLKKTDLLFENEGVLNPAIQQDGNTVHLFYRAVSTGNFSSIGYCRLKGPLTIELRHQTPLIFPEMEFELHGVEDPRIVKIEDTYYLTYTGYDGVNALGALATSKDLVTFDKKGIIAPQLTYNEFRHLAEANNTINEKYKRYNEHEHIEEKDGKKVLIWDKNFIYFPRKINNKFFFFHRVKPDIQLVAVSNLDELTEAFWKDHFIHLKKNTVLSPKHEHEISYIGGGCPPIETKDGWLMIYHGVHDTLKGYVYSACAALLDLENPSIEISRLPFPLFKPEYEWELKGEVNNVCFPCGTALFDSTLYIYYGAADEQVACASLNIDDLITELLLYKK